LEDRKPAFRTSETAYAVDRDGLIVDWNQSAVQTFGFTESEALGQRCWELLSGRDVFGNQLCCEGCPIRVTAFGNEPINNFQVDFLTAELRRNRFTVRTLMLFNEPGEELFVHLCRSEPNETNPIANHSVADIKPSTLTARETEVLTLLHKGISVEDIATALNISIFTVRNHTQHILVKLNAHSRFEAVALGRKLALI